MFGRHKALKLVRTISATSVLGHIGIVKTRKVTKLLKDILYLFNISVLDFSNA